MGTVDYLCRVRPGASVIFFEGIEEQSISGMRYHVYAYNMKRLKQQDLKTEIIRKINYANESSCCIAIKSDGEQIMIPIKNIIYNEGVIKEIILTVSNGAENTEASASKGFGNNSSQA